MVQHFTSGQAAKTLRISSSTLKRWLEDPRLIVSEQRNYNGWRLFSEADIDALKDYKREMRRNGKRFNDTTLIPVIVKNASGSVEK